MNKFPGGNDEANHRMWAEELRKADDRSNKFREDISILEKQRAHMDERLNVTIKQLEARDKEILRLDTLFEGGQNLDQLKARYVTDTNNETLSKLQNEIDFVNRENHRLDEELSEAK
jgi:hypothetical protein